MVRLVGISCLITYFAVSQIYGFESKMFHARKNLIEKLTNNSEIIRQFLPVVNSSQNVEVSITMTIQKIATVDEVNQALRLIVWLRFWWTNPFLTWNPEDYNNVTSVHLDNELLWKPDITLYNKASLEEEIDVLYKRLSTAIIVRHDGLCKWHAPATLLSQCKIDVTYFPFDDQICQVTLGSWTYAAHEIDVLAQEKTARLDFFAPSGEWDIVDAPMIRKQVKYSTGIYPDVTLHLRIRRRPLYYTLNLIIPCSVISLLSFLSFVLPTNHGERISLVITVLLAMSVYMLIVSSTLPQTSDAMPIIGTYFLCIIVEIACCLLATCFVAKLRVREGEMPKWLERLVNKQLACILFVETTVSEYAYAGTKGSYGNQLDAISASQTDAKAENTPTISVQCAGLDQIATEMAVLTDDVAIRQRRDIKSRKWQNAAKVLDRLFFILFLVVFTSLTAAIFGKKSDT